LDSVAADCCGALGCGAGAGAELDEVIGGAHIKFFSFSNFLSHVRVFIQKKIINNLVTKTKNIYLNHFAFTEFVC